MKNHTSLLTEIIFFLEFDILEENIIAILRLPQTIYQKILIIIEFFIKYGLGTKTYLGLSAFILAHPSGIKVLKAPFFFSLCLSWPKVALNERQFRD